MSVGVSPLHSGQEVEVPRRVYQVVHGPVLVLDPVDEGARVHLLEEVGGLEGVDRVELSDGVRAEGDDPGAGGGIGLEDDEELGPQAVDGVVGAWDVGG